MIKLSASAKTPAFTRNQAIVIGVKSVSGVLELLDHTIDSAWLDGLNLSALGASAKSEAIIRVPAPNDSVVALIGVGSDELDEDNLRELAGAAARALSAFEHITFDLPTSDARDAVSILEGAGLGQYELTTYKGTDKSNTIKTKAVTVVSTFKVSAAAIAKANIIIDSIKATRDLVNTPPNVLYPGAFANLVSKRVKGSTLNLSIWDEKALARDKFGGLLAVGGGSARPPRLVKVEYRPKGAKKHLALVGKGITFDSGGLSLKPAEGMVGMKYDMTGAATVFEALMAISQMAIPVRVTAWLCLAENMPSGTAQRPNDIIKARNGKSIEVLNTDAEGRLVLADGLSAASEEKPDMIVDVATLTGAATIALGNRYAGLMGTSQAISAVEAAAFDAGELVWHMPLPAELRRLLDSELADIANVKIGNRAGGMLIAGLFLREFVGFSDKRNEHKIEWAHLDIAGPVNNDAAPYGFTPKGATGVMLRTLVALAEGMAR
jgi:leucyl aminopeptidase